MRTDLSLARTLVAVVIALIGSVVLWVAVPYNNFWLQNNFISDNFLPVMVVAFLLVLVLVYNPLAKLTHPAWMLSRRQLALIASLWLFAAIVPGYGLMRSFPRMVAHTNQEMNQRLATARMAVEAELPQALFPDKVPTLDEAGEVVTYATPVSDQFLDELDRGESLPWSAWVVPMATWGALIALLWMMMLGLGGVVFPQWRQGERLPFPLLNVYDAFIGDPDEPAGRLLPPLFRSRGFWIAAGVVFFIHLMRGLNTYTSGVPSFPLTWNIEPYYSETFMRGATLALKRQTILFSVIGLAYFIPNRYAFSIWFWIVVQGLYVGVGRAYIPAFDSFQVFNHVMGTLFAIAVWVLWLGRAHWAKVGRAMLGQASGGPERRRDAVAGWMFALGCVGIVLWLNWAGCALWWSVLAMLGCAMVALLMARLIAETGIPIFWIPYFTLPSLTAMFPLKWQSPAILFFADAFNPLLSRTTAVSASVIATLALGIDKVSSMKYKARLLPGGLALMLLGFVIAGTVHLHMGYSSSTITTLPRMSAGAMDAWAGAERREYHFFTLDRAHQAGSFAVSTGLLWACSRFPTWPLHPIGVLFCQFSIGNLIWFSIFLGWAVKAGVTYWFGGGAYRAVRPVFIGLVIGELLSIILWSIVPVVIVLVTASDPSVITRYTILQYP